MRNKETFMTQTIQPRSWVSLSKPDTDLSVHDGEMEDNMDYLLQILDNLNNLYEKLNRLDYLLERKEIELNLYQKYKK